MPVLRGFRGVEAFVADDRCRDVLLRLHGHFSAPSRFDLRLIETPLRLFGGSALELPIGVAGAISVPEK